MLRPVNRGTLTLKAGSLLLLFVACGARSSLEIPTGVEALGGGEAVGAGGASPGGGGNGGSTVTGISCGNGIIEAGEQCDDGNQTSGDGCSVSCGTELGSCEIPVLVTLGIGSPQLFSGTTLGAPSQHTLINADGCAASSATGPESIYQVTVTDVGHVTAWVQSVGTDHDTVLYTRTSCESAESQLACHDNSANGGEVVSSWMEPGDTMFVFVDGGNGAAGAYQLNLDLSRGGICDDPVPITVEGSAPLFLEGTLASLSNDSNANGCNGAGSGADSVYELRFSNAGDYTIDLESAAFSPVIYAQTQCGDGGTEVDCDAPFNNDIAQVSFSVAANETRFVWVDTEVGAGDYSLTITH